MNNGHDDDEEWRKWMHILYVGGHLGEDTTSECVTTVIINMLACMKWDNSRAIYSMRWLLWRVLSCVVVSGGEQ